jgi:L-ascorbate peroxidase
MLSIADLI